MCGSQQRGQWSFPRSTPTESHHMLFKFKSRATADLIMLEPDGRRMLDIIGKGYEGDDPQGIITVEQMGPAIAALEAAVARELAQEQAQGSAARTAEEDKATARGEEPLVMLRQRAMPFIDMLRTSLAAKAVVTWGV